MVVYACRHVEIMQKTFAHFDTDNDGFITQEELCSMAKEKGFDCDASAVNSMMLEVDLNSDGRIDFQEVSIYSCRVPTLQFCTEQVGGRLLRGHGRALAGSSSSWLLELLSLAEECLPQIRGPDQAARN